MPASGWQASPALTHSPAMTKLILKDRIATVSFWRAAAKLAIGSDRQVTDRIEQGPLVIAKFVARISLTRVHLAAILTGHETATRRHHRQIERHRHFNE